jgi:hypothetical protein
MWYTLLIAYLLAFPVLVASLYAADRLWRSSFVVRIRGAVRMAPRHYELHDLELLSQDSGHPFTRTVLMVERTSPWR